MQLLQHISRPCISLNCRFFFAFSLEDIKFQINLNMVFLLLGGTKVLILLFFFYFLKIHSNLIMLLCHFCDDGGNI